MRHLLDTSQNRTTAAALLGKGGVVVVPTDTLYGLAASVYNHDSVARVFAIKGRPTGQGLPVLIGSMAQITEVAAHVPGDALALAEHFWPGPLTLVLKRRPELPPEVSGGLESVAVRQPNHAAPLKLIELSGTPITGTSANLSGGFQPVSAEEVIRQVGKLVDVVLDAGPCAVGEPSTIVDATVTPCRIIRAGAISLKELQKVCLITDKPNRNPSSSPG
jgi:L-threonylcarbamoyladenylate synthase